MSIRSVVESPKSPRSNHHRGITINDSYDDNHESLSTSSTIGVPIVRKRFLTIPRTGTTISHDNVINCKIIKYISPKILYKAKELVQEAILNKKIFMIFGPYDKIRKGLRKRGWVEKMSDRKSLFNAFHKSLKQHRLQNIKKSLVKVDGDIESVNSSIKELDDFNNMDLPDDKDSQSDIDKEKSEKDEDEDGGIDEQDVIEKLKNDDEAPEKNEDEYDNDLLQAVASHYVYNCNADLIWTLRTTQFNHSSLKSYQMTNHYRKAGSFTTKSGLIRSFNNLRWFEKDPDEMHPRTYIISEEPERKAFIDDFYLTACMALVKIAAILSTSSDNKTHPANNHQIITDNNNSKSVRVVPTINYSRRNFGDSPHKIEKRHLEMAVHYCQLYQQNKKFKNVDKLDTPFCSYKRWEEFFKNYQLVTEEMYGIDLTDNLKNVCQKLVKEFTKSHHQFLMDGYKNVWIVKPGAKSRGRGIHCISRLTEMYETINNIYETLVVQKYIERPLLVYNTKFDIRQWFLVTSWSPLTIWWYQDCYIRFCSQQFTLNDLNESVHLSNNSIQYKYKNGPRSKFLPENNMWHWQQFEKYLKQMGHGDAWQAKILPTMKNTIIDILLCTQDQVEERKSSFELYGADFMITDPDLKTWILEINSSPCMAPSTDVTAKLTQTLSDDILKVILDYPANTFCDTGRFELVYEQYPFTMPVCEKSSNLVIRGNGIKKPYSKKNHKNSLSESSEDNQRKSFCTDDKSFLRQKLRSVITNPRHTYSESAYSTFGSQSDSRKMGFKVPRSISNVPHDTSIKLRQKQRMIIMKRFSEINTNRDKFFTNFNKRTMLNSYHQIGSGAVPKRSLSPLSERSINESKPVVGKENSLPSIPTNPVHRVFKPKYQSIAPSILNNLEKDGDINRKMSDIEPVSHETSSNKKPITLTHAYKSLIKKSLEENQSLLNKLNSYPSKMDATNRRINQIMAAYMPKHCLT